MYFIHFFPTNCCRSDKNHQSGKIFFYTCGSKCFKQAKSTVFSAKTVPYGLCLSVLFPILNLISMVCGLCRKILHKILSSGIMQGKPYSGSYPPGHRSRCSKHYLRLHKRHTQHICRGQSQVFSNLIDIRCNPVCILHIIVVCHFHQNSDSAGTAKLS